MGIPGQYTHPRMRQAYEATAKAARAHGKSFGVGGGREDLEFQTWLMQLGMRYLTGGSDVGYILSAGRADVKRIREARSTRVCPQGARPQASRRRQAW
jgi:4-hydroxy-2-oxoheptanedioate aldolase